MKKSVKEKIKLTKKLWDFSLEESSKYSSDYFDKNISDKLSNPIFSLASNLVEDLLGTPLKKLEAGLGWVNGKYICLGTDGFGRSDTREKLRDFFEIDHNHIVYYALIIANKNKEALQFAHENKLDLKRENPWQN